MHVLHLIHRTKVECGACCLSNKYYIAFRWEDGTKLCEGVSTLLLNVVYGNDTEPKGDAANRVEVYRDETLIEDTCMKKGNSGH